MNVWQPKPDAPAKSSGMSKPVNGPVQVPTSLARQASINAAELARSLGRVLVLSILAANSGCRVMDQFRAPTAVAPTILDPAATTLDQLTSALNARTAKVRQLKSSVRVAAAGMPGLRGDLLVERPQRLRLQAGLMGMNEAGFDLGSNDEAFWIWQKVALPGQPETFWYARHIDYQHSQLRAALQLQPVWLIDALGLVEFSPSDRHEGPLPRPDGRVEIRTWSSRPGQTAIRRTVLDPRTLEVHQQSFYEPNGQLVAWLDSIRHEHYEDPGISLPRRIDIHVPGGSGEQMRLTVDAGQYSINSIYGDPAKLWQMPEPAGVRRVNLSEGLISEPVAEAAARPPGPSDRPASFR